MKLMCNGISIIHRNNHGCLSGPKVSVFTVTFDGVDYDVCVEQFGIRKVTVKSSQKKMLKIFWSLYLNLEMLLMLFDGKFISIESGKILLNDEEIVKPELDELIATRVTFYQSADFTIGENSNFCDFEEVLNARILMTWIKLLTELDILHPMVLYSMSDTGLTIDCKCAFLIEAFEALAELVAGKNSNYELPHVSKGESKLKKRLISIIDVYGQDIFQREIEKNKDEFTDILIASRNRIAHIKSRQDKHVLNGEESMLYAVKLSYLYRVVLLDLLGVDYKKYSNKMRASVEKWNDWQDVEESFLQKLNKQDYCDK